MTYKVNIIPGRKKVGTLDIDETLKKGCEEAAKYGTGIYVCGRHGCGKSSVLEYYEAKAQELFGIDESEVLLVTGDMFINDVVSGIRGGHPESSMQKYEKAKMIILDDVSLLEGKDASQEALRRILDSEKLVIFSGTQSIGQLKLVDSIKCKMEHFTIMEVSECNENMYMGC